MKATSEIAEFNGLVAMRLPEDHVVIFDSGDLSAVRRYRWAPLRTSTGRTYAVSYAGGDLTYMHRLILSPPDEYVTDHRNNHGLDNRRCNLRRATSVQNMANTMKRAPLAGGQYTSRFKGVSWAAPRGKWLAQIGYRDQTGRQCTRFLGRYLSEIDAAVAYDVAASEMWGEFARLNFPEGDLP